MASVGLSLVVWVLLGLWYAQTCKCLRELPNTEGGLVLSLLSLHPLTVPQKSTVKTGSQNRA